MRIWKQFILAVIFAIASITFTACDKGTDSGTDASSGTDAGRGTDAGEKIIGTWVDGYGIYWDFNADGNLTLSGNSGTDVLLKFGVTDTKLVISSVTGIINSPEGIYNIYMSPNERTLILVRQNNNNYVAFVLTKELYTEQAPVFA